MALALILNLILNLNLTLILTLPYPSAVHAHGGDLPYVDRRHLVDGVSLAEVWPAWKCPRHPCIDSLPGTPTPPRLSAGAPLARLEIRRLCGDSLTSRHTNPFTK